MTLTETEIILLVVSIYVTFILVLYGRRAVYRERVTAAYVKLLVYHYEMTMAYPKLMLADLPEMVELANSGTPNRSLRDLRRFKEAIDIRRATIDRIVLEAKRQAPHLYPF